MLSLKLQSIAQSRVSTRAQSRRAVSAVSVVASAAPNAPNALNAAETTATSRRAAVTTLLGLSAAILAPSAPANAFLGIGEDPSAKYVEQTQTMIDAIRAALELPHNTDEREAAMSGVKKQTVAWVSDYRRDPKFAGRPSFSQMYSAVNALDGQLVSFGLKANFPAKRKERMMKSIDDAERQLKRGR